VIAKPARHLVRLAITCAVIVAGAVRPAAAASCVVVVLDNSGSMTGNDPNRQAVRSASMLVDLMEAGDAFAVIPINGAQLSRVGDLLTPEMQIRALTFIQYAGGTTYAGAMQELQRRVDSGCGINAEPRNTLVILLGDGDLQDSAASRPVADTLRARGIGIDGIFLGRGQASAFNDLLTAGHRPFPVPTGGDRTEGDAAMVKAFAEVFQQFLGARRLQHGLRQAAGSFSFRTTNRASGGTLLVVFEGGSGTATIETGPTPTSVRKRDIEGKHHEVLAFAAVPPSSDLRVRVDIPSGQRYSWMWIERLDVELDYTGDRTFFAGSEGRLRTRTRAGRPSVPMADPAAKIKATIEGRQVELFDDGLHGDGAAADGEYGAATTFGPAATGRSIPVEFVLTSDVVERRLIVPIEVKQQTFDLVGNYPPRVTVGEPFRIEAQLRFPALPRAGVPAKVTARVTGPDGQRSELELKDEGTGPKDGRWLFTGTLAGFGRAGNAKVVISTTVDGATREHEGTVAVIGYLRIAKSFTGRVDLGDIAAHDTVEQEVQLAGIEVSGGHELELTMEGAPGDVELEFNDGGTWKPVDPLLGRARLRVDETTKTLKLRVRVASCPGGFDSAMTPWRIVLSNGSERGAIEVAARVASRGWIECYWRWMVGAVLTVLALLWVWGWFSHPRFAPRLQFVQVPNLGDAQGWPGVTLRTAASGRRWYKPQQAFICWEAETLAVRGRPRGTSVARIVAMEGGAARVENTSGTLSKCPAGEWVWVAASESIELDVSYAASGREGVLKFQI